MQRDFGIIVRVIAVVVAFFWATDLASGQTTIFNSNGFESPTFTATSIVGQQGFLTVPGSPSSGMVQTGTVRTGSQAF